MMRHLDAEAIYDLLDGRMEPGRARAAEAHLWRCDACRNRREECAAALDSLRWYGEAAPSAPDGYWDAFWRRWPMAGDVGARAAAGTRRFPRAGRVAAAAAVAAIAVGSWWTWQQVDPVPGEVDSPATASMAAARSAVPVEEARSTAEWQADIEVLRQVSFPIGSVDPLSKGVVLASLAQEP